jgi:hypothetical protein
MPKYANPQQIPTLDNLTLLMKSIPIILSFGCFIIMTICFLSDLLKNSIDKGHCEFSASLLPFNYTSKQYSLSLDDEGLNLVHRKTGKNLTLNIDEKAQRYTLNGIQHTHSFHSDKLIYRYGTCYCLLGHLHLQPDKEVLGTYGREMLMAQCLGEICSSLAEEKYLGCLFKNHAAIEEKAFEMCQSKDFSDKEKERLCITNACLSEISKKIQESDLRRYLYLH